MHGGSGVIMSTFDSLTGGSSTSVSSDQGTLSPDGQSNTLTENMSLGKNPGSVWWLLLMFVIYFVWDYAQGKKPIADAIEPSNIRANLHNMLVIGLAAAIFFNGANVVLTKLASMKIPVISKTAGTFLPFVQV